jgi:hypothetical protein
MWNPFKSKSEPPAPPAPISPERPHILVITVHGKDAIRKWEELRAQYETTGLWPLVIGAPEDQKLLFGEVIEGDVSGPSYTGDPAGWFAWRKQQREQLEGATFDDIYDGIRGEWPANVKPYDTFTVPTHILTGRWKPSVIIALLPVKHVSEVPVMMGFGGWNECPFPDDHATVFRHWNARYGAEPVCMTGDLLEFRVANPPTTKDDALKLAEEQFIYCEDIVVQGTETIENLAASLLDATKWYFWWD